MVFHLPASKRWCSALAARLLALIWMSPMLDVPAVIALDDKALLVQSYLPQQRTCVSSINRLHSGFNVLRFHRLKVCPLKAPARAAIAAASAAAVTSMASLAPLARAFALTSLPTPTPATR